jgi:hypothetical protein
MPLTIRLSNDSAGIFQGTTILASTPALLISKSTANPCAAMSAAHWSQASASVVSSTANLPWWQQSSSVEGGHQQRSARSQSTQNTAATAAPTPQ